MTKSGFYRTTGNDQLSGWTKKKLQSTSQSQTCTKKRSWSPFSGLLLVSSTKAFWIMMKPLHLRSMLSKLITAMPIASSDQQKGPNSSPWQCQLHIAKPTCQKLNKSGYEVLPHPPYSPDTNQLLLQISWQLFAAKSLPQPAEYRKCFSRVHRLLKHRFLCYKNKQTYFLVAKMFWL